MYGYSNCFNDCWHFKLASYVIKGRRPEIEELNCLVVQKGKELNVSTPMNEAIVNLMRALQKGEVNPELENIDRLKLYLLVSS